MIEQVNEIKAALQIARLPYLWNVIVLLQSSIDLTHPSVAVDIPWQGPFQTSSGTGKSAAIVARIRRRDYGRDPGVHVVQFDRSPVDRGASRIRHDALNVAAVLGKAGKPAKEQNQQGQRAQGTTKL